MFVQQSVIYRGSIVDTGNPQAPDFLLGYAGNQTVFVEAPFNGALFAPNGSITLSSLTQGFVGQFYAMNIEVDPHTTVTQRTFHCAGP